VHLHGKIPNPLKNRNSLHEHLTSGKKNTVPVFYCTVIAILIMFQLNACATPTTRIIKNKADQSVATLHEWIEEGRDVTYIVPKMKKVKVLADSGKLDEANTLLDEILFYFETHGKAMTQNALETAEFINDVEVKILGYDDHIMEAFISRDGKYMFFNDKKKNEDKDIYFAEKIDDYTFQFKGEVKGINTKAVEGVPTLDTKNNFYYVSTHAYKIDNLVTMYQGKFVNGKVTQIRAISEISLNKPGWLNMDSEISADGNTLYSTQTYFGDGQPPSKSYFFYAKKHGDKFIPQNDSANIFKTINRDDVVYGATISSNELEIIYTRLVKNNKLESLRATRKDKNSAFGIPRVISTIRGFSEAPALTGDGELIYYHKKSNSDSRFKLHALHRNHNKTQ
jgi:hypothetical protein